MATITCIVVTPEETALEQTTDFVALPLYDGELGVAANHAPLIGRLGYGELRLGTGQTAKRYYVDGGFVQIADNVVSVMTNRAVAADELDAAEIQERLQSATSQAAPSDDLIEARDRVVTQARAQLRIAQRG